MAALSHCVVLYHARQIITVNRNAFTPGALVVSLTGLEIDIASPPRYSISHIWRQ